MQVSISSGHFDVTPLLEKAIRSKIGRLDRYLSGLDQAVVHFDQSRNRPTGEGVSCEVTLTGHGHHLRCSVSASDLLTAVDLAEAKLARQIRKTRTRMQQRYQGRGETIRGPVSASEPVAGGTTVTEPG